MTEPLASRYMVGAVAAALLLLVACTGTNGDQVAENGTAGRQPEGAVTTTSGPAPLDSGDKGPAATPMDSASASAFHGEAAGPSPAASPSTSGEQDKPQAQAGPILIVEMYGELDHIFQTVGELVSATPVIVVGQVLDSKDAPYENIPFTVLTVEVEQAFKGSVAAGDRLTIVETGGLLRGRSKVAPGQYGPPVEVAFEGVPVMKVGERWLLFLGGYDPGPVATNAYSVMGVFQGKFEVGGDGRVAFTGPAERIEEPIFAVPAMLNGRLLGEVIAEIKSALSGS